MRNSLLTGVLVFGLALSASAVFVPSKPVRPLPEVQDASLVTEHAKAVEQVKEDGTPVIPVAWISSITAMVAQNSERELDPAEIFSVVFDKSGKVATLAVIFPRNAKRTPNQADVNHETCAAMLGKKQQKPVLTPKAMTEGPDGYELFGVQQLPIVCRELGPIRKLQQAFTANGLAYTLEARVVPVEEGKHWAWEIAPSVEQSPNIIYGMTYQPISQELVVVPIKDAKISAKVQKAADAAGMKLKWEERQ